MNTNKYHIAILASGVTIFLLPLFANPDLFLERGNDLQEFFWPLMTYSSRYILKFQALPFWNPLWFGGMPLIADPQAPIWYPLNIIFLLFPIKTAFLIGISLHVSLSTFFTYQLSKLLNYSKKTSVVIALSYIFIPRLATYIEAGHWGLIVAWAWIPAYLYQLVKTQRNLTKIQTLLLGITIGFLFLAHAITAVIVVGASYLVFVINSKTKIRFSGHFLISIILAIGLISPVLVPQILWQSSTTRNLLSVKPDTYPKWQSKSEFVKSIVRIPDNYDTEKIITIGLIPLFFVLVGLTVIKVRYRVVLISLGLIILFISMNNVSIASGVVTTAKLFALFRVNTRPWILVFIATPFIVGKVLDKINNRRLYLIVAIGLLINYSFLSFKVLSQIPDTEFRLPSYLYMPLVNNSNESRIYCPDRCLSQKDSAENSLLTIDGYATLIPYSFYVKSWGLFGGYWDYYTLSLPPFGASKFQNLVPDTDSLGEYNVKYLILNKRIYDKNLDEVSTLNNYILYENKVSRGYAYMISDSRTEWQTLSYLQKPNKFEINTDNHLYNTLVIAQTYTPGFTANDNHSNPLQVAQGPNGLLHISVPKEVTKVIVSYHPPGFRIGMLLFIITLLVSLVLLIL